MHERTTSSTTSINLNSSSSKKYTKSDALIWSDLQNQPGFISKEPDLQVNPKACKKQTSGVSGSSAVTTASSVDFGSVPDGKALQSTESNILQTDTNELKIDLN